MEPNANILVFYNPEQLAHSAAERFSEYAQNGIRERGRFSVSLAGGNTPKGVYQLLATEKFKNRIEWSKVDLFFGDERCVPPENPESNYAMAYETLISRVPIPAHNVHRILGEAEPGDSARFYEEELMKFFPGVWPSFDLVLLGMGDDGHTASLFPHTQALREENAWVTANWVEKLRAFRITASVPVLNHAAHIIFLVTGADKAERLAEVLNGPFNPERLPAQMIKPFKGTLEWMVDQQAASLLQ